VWIAFTFNLWLIAALAINVAIIVVAVG